MLRPVLAQILVLVGVATGFLLTSACQTRPPAECRRVLPVQVLVHRDVKGFGDSEVKAILDETQKILKTQCEQLADSRPGTCELILTSEGKTRILEAPTADQVLSAVRTGDKRPKELVVKAVLESFRTGAFSEDSLRTLMVLARTTPKVLSAYVVPLIAGKSPCERAGDHAVRSGGQIAKKGEVNYRVSYQTPVGCAQISDANTLGKGMIVTSLGTVKDSDWRTKQAQLWAHEISHLFSLPDLEDPNDDNKYVDRLMGQQSGTKLIPEECVKLAEYIRRHSADAVSN